MYYYLNFDGADSYQVNKFEKTLADFRWTLNQETGYTIHLYTLNYYRLFWKIETFFGMNMPFWVKNKIQRAIEINPNLKTQKKMLTPIFFKYKTLRWILKRYRKEQYYKRAIPPMLSAFIFSDFDVDILTRAIAFELQILRVFHQKFIWFVLNFFKIWFTKFNNASNRLEALVMKIKGRLTLKRRQIPRSNLKIYRFGKIKRSDQGKEAGHALYFAYNRYGVISVSISYQKKTFVSQNTTTLESKISNKLLIETSLKNFGLKQQILVNNCQMLQQWTKKNFLYTKYKKFLGNNIKNYPSVLISKKRKIISVTNSKFLQTDKSKNQTIIAN